MNRSMPPIVLASASPRRQALLRDLKLPFSVRVAGSRRDTPGRRKACRAGSAPCRGQSNCGRRPHTRRVRRLPCGGSRHGGGPEWTTSRQTGRCRRCDAHAGSAARASASGLFGPLCPRPTRQSPAHDCQCHIGHHARLYRRRNPHLRRHRRSAGQGGRVRHTARWVCSRCYVGWLSGRGHGVSAGRFV